MLLWLGLGSMAEWRAPGEEGGAPDGEATTDRPYL